jgi:hypothetical protein
MAKATKRCGTTKERLNPSSVTELYQQCLKREKGFTSANFQELQLQMGKALLFGRPLFEPDPDLDPSAIKPERDLKIRKGLWRGAKYRDILELLQKCRDRETRLFLLAWWLKSEGVCEPEDLISGGKIRRLSKERLRGLSFADFQNAFIVQAWLPYFQGLLAAMRHAREGPSTSLDQFVEAGFDRTAALAANKKRSAVPAICDWLAAPGRLERQVDAPALRNAYSRVFGKRSSLGPGTIKNQLAT